MECNNVLIIEDDSAIRSMMRNILELEGYNVFEASDGKIGIDVLRAIVPIPCVVLLDLMMPGTNGWEFLDVQRTDPSLKNVPIIVCSAYSESAKAVKPSGFISKPVQLDSLLKTVHEFCA